MTSAGSRCQQIFGRWKADGGISRAEKSETKCLPKGRSTRRGQILPPMLEASAVGGSGFCRSRRERSWEQGGWLQVCEEQFCLGLLSFPMWDTDCILWGNWTRGSPIEDSRTQAQTETGGLSEHLGMALWKPLPLSATWFWKHYHPRDLPFTFHSPRLETGPRKNFTDTSGWKYPNKMAGSPAGHSIMKPISWKVHTHRFLEAFSDLFFNMNRQPNGGQSWVKLQSEKRETIPHFKKEKWNNLKELK